MNRRCFLMTALFVPAGLAPASAQAPSWPATTLHLVPFAAGDRPTSQPDCWRKRYRGNFHNA